jgi:hypothetical protein
MAVPNKTTNDLATLAAIIALTASQFLSNWFRSPWTTLALETPLAVIAALCLARSCRAGLRSAWEFCARLPSHCRQLRYGFVIRLTPVYWRIVRFWDGVRWRVLYSRRRVLARAVVVGLAVAVVWTVAMPRIYATRTLITVDQHPASALPDYSY